MRTWLQRLNELEAPLCVAWNRRGHRRWIRRFFQVVSRLGDGVVWYLTMALLPISLGTDGLATSIHMLSVGAVSLLVYKILKSSTHRSRPSDHSEDIERFMPALDEFSFPSGHTLHAVGFTLVIAYHFPSLGGIFAIFTLFVASSRLVLGLHYPSDVVAGTLLGSIIALVSCGLI